ncbi:MAG: GNAT family N-acetyltransferase [Gemmatimonadaceae bacterium]|jgi:GNAT superfamily N-acetyltransferase|nr:GNAT family N-acetyltransferase [Gemmatimonadaceae bacterium]
MSTPTAIIIRPLTDADHAVWASLWRGYLDFYQTTLPDEQVALTWRRLHDPLVPLHAFGAEVEGVVLGIVHYLYHASAWTRGPYCYLQDLFTAPEARGRGVGRALIEAVYAAARDAGADRVYWLTQHDNATARALYDRVASSSGFIQYRKRFDPPA